MIDQEHDLNNFNDHIDVIEGFLGKEEVAFFHTMFNVDTYTDIYGYGHVDVPNSLVERLQKVLLKGEDDNENDINEGKIVVLTSFLT